VAINWMRTSAFLSCSPLGPYYAWYADKINDGLLFDSTKPINNAYVMTIDQRSVVNIGIGSDIRFNQPLTLRSFRIYAYTTPVTEVTVDYYNDNTLLLKYVRQLSRVERQYGDGSPSSWLTYNIPNAPTANRVKVYISGWDGIQNDFSIYRGYIFNYYAFELEAYEENLLTDVLVVRQSGEWIAPFAVLAYKNGEWIREGMPMSYHDKYWNEFV